jgi:hypothetical protein
LEEEVECGLVEVSQLGESGLIELGVCLGVTGRDEFGSLLGVFGRDVTSDGSTFV